MAQRVARPFHHPTQLDPSMHMQHIRMTQEPEKDRFRWLRLPANDASRPEGRDTVSVYVLVLLPWLIVYQAVACLGLPRLPLSWEFAFERRLAVWEPAELFYAGAFPFVLMGILLARSRS